MRIRLDASGKQLRMIKLIARVLTFKFVLDGLKARRAGQTDPASSALATTQRRGTSSARAASRSRERDPQAGGAARPNGDGGGIPVQSGEGPGPDSPLDLEPPDWKATAKRTLKEIKDDRITLVAAGMAYYGFLALFPAVIAAVGVLGLLQIPPAVIQDIESSMRSALPAGASEIVGDAIENAKNPERSASLTAAVVGIAIALWSASSGFVALQKGLDVAYDISQERKFLKARLVAFVLIVATGVLGGVPSPIFTFGESTVFVVIGWILTVVAVMVLFSLFYYLGPNRDSPRWTWVSAGGVLGALLWLGASAAFGIYVNNFSSYGETYGTMAGVVVLILWLFLTSVSVLIGGELNAELERQAAKTTAK